MIRDLAQWHEHPRLVAGAATARGRALVWVLAGALLLWLSAYAYPVIRPLLGLVAWSIPLVTLWPGRRREILSGASVVALLAMFRNRNLPGLELLGPGTWELPAANFLRFAVLAGGTLSALAGCVWAARNMAGWPALLRRFPVGSVHAGVWAIIALIMVAPLLGIAVELLPLLVWRLSYLFQYFWRSRVPAARFRDHLFYLWPVAGFSRAIPIGKGLDYLARHEARDPTQLAGSQLAGLKLLGLAVAWTVLTWCFDSVVFGHDSPARGWFGGWSLGLPGLGVLLESGRTETLAAVMALYLQLIRDTLHFAAEACVLTACFRLVGFRIYRDLYRPLLATSVVEFWNRRSWYFKEMLTEFFFYPTFLRASWAPPRLRLFLATFAAAGLGNLYFHVLFSTNVVRAGYGGIIVPMIVSHATYCVLLATGIWLSMLRQRVRRRLSPLIAPWQKIRAIAGVWTFYAVVHIWSGSLGSLGPLDRLRWLIAVLGP